MTKEYCYSSPSPTKGASSHGFRRNGQTLSGSCVCERHSRRLQEMRIDITLPTA